MNIKNTVLLIILFFSISAQANELDDRNAVKAVAQEWITLYTARDLDALMQLYTDDATVALHGKPILKGKQAIRDFFAQGIGKSKVDFKIDIELIEIYGDVAHFLSKYYLTAISKENASVYKDAGRSFLVYKRNSQGHWKLHLDIDQATPDVVFE